MKLDDLAHASSDELEEFLRAGLTPAWDALAGSVFRGWNVGLFPHVLRIKKFAKGFLAEEKDGRRLGYNCPARQGALESPWELLPSPSAPKRFGYYVVRTPAPGDQEYGYPGSLLLDYGRGENPWWEPARVLRDYLVQAEPGNGDLYVGKAYVALGWARVAAGFFLLERLASARS